MKLKTNLHFHTKEDKQDFIDHSALEGIDYAASLGFTVLAITPHLYFWHSKELDDYAASKNILLIWGTEIEINKKHIVVLNCGKDVEEIKSFKDLEVYKNNHPEIFVLASHPFYGRKSLNGHLEENIHLFDAIELSWFYSRFFNRNKKAELIAKKYSLPFIATSDTHFLDFCDKNYILVDVKEKSVKAIFEAIRRHKFENITSARNFLNEMVWSLGKFLLKSTFLRLRRYFFK